MQRSDDANLFAAPSVAPPPLGEAAPAKWIRVRYERPRVGPWVQVDSLAGYEWNRVELAISDLPAALQGARIVHLSDLHLTRRWRPEYDDLLSKLAERPPDLILFTGDFVDDKRDHGPALPTLERLIRGLPVGARRAAPNAAPGAGGASQIFAILGNHDGDLLAPRLAALGVPLITHRRVDAVVRGAPVEVIGLPGPDRTDLDERFLHAQPPRRAGVPRIVLCHYPDLIRPSRRLRPDLYLAGHTHGGQMCLWNEWPPMTHDALPRRMCKGAHDYHGTCLLVSRGFGFTTAPVRLWCPAEVVEVEMRGNAEG
ncbi:MAG TPA: metallophosphoesterase [Tepidisphaeraceae bacterium]|nr:metallophosphoesterase [Tepidisphaeraceae bacterium]